MMPLKVMTFNVNLVCVGPACFAAGNEEDVFNRAKKIGEWIKAQDPDLVFLQEVVQKRHFYILQQLSGLPYAHFSDEITGLGFLSRFPVSDFSEKVFSWQGANFIEAKRLVVGWKKVFLQGKLL